MSGFAAGFSDVCLPDTSLLHASPNADLTASQTNSQTTSQTISQTTVPRAPAHIPSQTRTSETRLAGVTLTNPQPAVPSPPCFYVPTTNTSHANSITEPQNSSFRQNPIAADTPSMIGSDHILRDTKENGLNCITHRSFPEKPSDVFESDPQEGSSHLQQHSSLEGATSPLNTLSQGGPSGPLQTFPLSTPSSNPQQTLPGGYSSHYSQNNPHNYRKSPHTSLSHIHVQSSHSHILVTPKRNDTSNERSDESNALALINHLYRSLNFSPISPAHNTALYHHNSQNPKICSSTPVNYQQPHGASQKYKIPNSTSPIPKVPNRKAAITNAWNQHENKAVNPVIMLPSCSTTPQSSTSAAPLPHFQQSSRHHRPFRGLHAYIL